MCCCGGGSGEMLLFGGEYYDGDVTVCYNGVFRWNLEKNEWRAVESINTPPPRCSHQVPHTAFSHCQARARPD